MRAATVEGEAIVEADGERFLVVRLPRTVEVTDPEEIAVVLDCAAEYTGSRYSAEETLEMLRREVATER